MNFNSIFSLLRTLFGSLNFTIQLLKALLTKNYDKKSHLYTKKTRIRVYLEVLLVLHSGCEFRRRELQFERAPLTDWWWGRHGACAAWQTDRMPSDEPCNTPASRPVILARTATIVRVISVLKMMIGLCISVIKLNRKLTHLVIAKNWDRIVISRRLCLSCLACVGRFSKLDSVLQGSWSGHVRAGPLWVQLDSNPTHWKSCMLPLSLPNLASFKPKILANFNHFNFAEKLSAFFPQTNCFDVDM